MLHILRQIEAISASRDRDLLAALVVAGIKESFPGVRSAALMRQHGRDAFALIARADTAGLQVVSADTAGEMLDVMLPPALHDELHHGRATCIEREHCWLCALPIDTSAASAQGLLLVELDRTLAAEQQEALERFTRFYANYVRLLDYSERDTLTQLFNRKTFDESFDRLLAAAEQPGRPPGTTAERRAAPPEGDTLHWIAVADIDHFKRVNDTYGHLFGDEVLIRFAGLMRQAFRASDRLFRFGGEEFVILLRPTNEANARRTLERFRKRVEACEFPQVGRVSCSIGYAPISPRLAPSDILGHADLALYYGKEHGRNQVNSYQDLVARGLLPPPKEPEARQPDEFDALFG